MLKGVLVGLAVLGFASSHAAPNILLIVSDDHARAAISAYGSPHIQTPHIDQLAREGVRFDRHYTPNPLCAPSRAAILTGKHAHINGHRDNTTTFDGDQPTFPKALQAAGYETAVIGKWHLQSDPTGFDDFDVLPGQGAYYDPVFISREGRTTAPGYVTEIITEKSLAWMRQPRTKPFFLMVGHKAPHRNFIPSPSTWTLFLDKTFAEPPNLRTDYAGLNSMAPQVSMRIDRHMRLQEDLMVQYAPPALEGDRLAQWQAAWAAQDQAYAAQLEASRDLLATNYQRYLRNYMRCVKSVDDSVGALLDELRRTGQDKNTVVIYTSDQGFFLGENGWYDKRWFYEPSAGTPLIVRRPRLRPAVATALTSNVDLAPTILEAAGVAVPADMQGRSLWPVTQRPTDLTNRNLTYGHFYESEDPDHRVPRWVGIATQRNKLIYYYDLKEWELFDVVADPYEQKNLWPLGPNATRAELTRKLVAEMRRLKEDPDLIFQVNLAISRG